MLRLETLSVMFGATRVLDRVSVELFRGQLVGLIGPPASGKTTLLKTLAGLVPPSSGEVWVETRPLTHASPETLAGWQRRVGMAFQNDALFDAQTVFDNVAFGLRRRGVAEPEIAARVKARLDEVGLLAAQDKLPSELSGGMRKRVGIARATVCEPEVGLFDDPIAGLDPLTSAQILRLVVALHRRLETATIVVSNDLPVLLPICDRVVMLHRGQVVFDGAPAALAQAREPVVRQFATGADEGPL